MLTFRIKGTDSKVTANSLASKDTRQKVAGPRKIKATRPILREAETRNTVLTATGMDIPRLSVSESPGILDIKSLGPMGETTK